MTAGGRPHTGGTAFEKFPAKLVFECLHPGKGRLRQIQRCCGPMQAALFDHGQKGAKL